MSEPMSHKRASRFIERLTKRLHRLLHFGEWGDWQIEVEAVDADHVGHHGNEALVGWQQATPPYFAACIEIPTRQPEDGVVKATVHEHLHVALADVRRAVTMICDGDTESVAWRMYDDAEERVVTRLERAFVALLGERG
jgi:hypothetical protein